MARKTDRSELSPTLSKLVTFLAHPRTAAQIADHFDVTRPTAYARLAALVEHGYKFAKSEPKREGLRGPASATFILA